MILAEKTLAAINDAWQHDPDPLRGTHLGAGSIGKSCSRELWYQFRWAAQTGFSPRILRLFERGNREEKVFEELLRLAGIPFWGRDPATNKQYVVRFKNKHLLGYADGIGQGLPDLPTDERFLGEWKTHNEKSFKDLVKKGVRESKPVHFTQMQLYMNELRLGWALYGAVNKNDDHLHLELIEHDSEYAAHYRDRADLIVASQTPPQRISENPGWYECKWCDFYRICHLGRSMEVNCRTCQHVRPLADGEWWCGQHDKILTTLEQRSPPGLLIPYGEVPTDTASNACSRSGRGMRRSPSY